MPAIVRTACNSKSAWIYAAKAKQTGAISRSVQTTISQSRLAILFVPSYCHAITSSVGAFIENICFLATRVRACLLQYQHVDAANQEMASWKVPLCSRMRDDVLCFKDFYKKLLKSRKLCKLALRAITVVGFCLIQREIFSPKWEDNKRNLFWPESRCEPDLPHDWVVRASGDCKWTISVRKTNVNNKLNIFRSSIKLVPCWYQWKMECKSFLQLAPAESK